MTTINKPFELEGSENTRELGGYKTGDSKITKEKVYLRSDKTNELTRTDIEKLIDYGVTMVTDLRSREEIERNPSVFMNMDGIVYKNIPMLDGLSSMEKGLNIPSSMFELYKDILDKGQENIRKIFKGFLDNNGVSLFHCTAGKDRTGVVSMLLLQLAGVDDKTIVEDYSQSENNLLNFIKKQKEFFKSIEDVEIPEHFLYSKKEDMEKTLEYLYENYQNARNYLIKVGLTEDEVNILNERFLA